MRLLSPSRIQALRVHPARRIVEEALLHKTREVRALPVMVPDSLQAKYMGFYYCPTHSTRLTHCSESPHAHLCPVDGEVFSGDPYDGAWWEITNRVNYNGAYHLGLLYLLTGQREYAAPARALLLAYARKYASYAPNGGQAYNGPGLACPQTINEAMLLQTFAFAYDLTEETFTLEERSDARAMFSRGAAFLLAHREPQLHNHEVIICSSLATLGLLLGDEGYLQAAVNGPFGLRDQLRRGLLPDGLWFEGSLQYHNFTLKYYLLFKKFAAGTEWATDDPVYLAMALKNLAFLTHENKLPLLNDNHYYYDYLDVDGTFEYLYAQTHDQKMGWLLRQAYADRPRDPVEAFFFGQWELPQLEGKPVPSYYHGKGSGLTVFKDANRYLLIKHAPFGGEHDHYDRLALYFTAFGQPFCADFGTGSYGGPYHYAYYKNTATHNTVCIDGKNQPPAHCCTRLFYHTENESFLACTCEWPSPEPVQLTNLLVQWDDQAYQGVRMYRQIAWLDGCVIDVFRVRCPSPRQIDWLLHVDGALTRTETQFYRNQLGEEGAYRFLHDVRSFAGSSLEWTSGTAALRLCIASPGTERLLSRGPSCPSVKDVYFITERVQGTDALFINLLDASQDGARLGDVSIKRAGSRLCLSLCFNGRKRVFCFETDQDLPALNVFKND